MGGYKGISLAILEVVKCPNEREGEGKALGHSNLLERDEW